MNVETHGGEALHSSTRRHSDTYRQTVQTLSDRQTGWINYTRGYQEDSERQLSEGNVRACVYVCVYLFYRRRLDLCTEDSFLWCVRVCVRAIVPR